MPAFLALVAEPLFLLADAAIVGRLGVAPLAGLGVASAVLLTSANIFVFLAYGTTAVVARQLGAGSRAGAIAAGIDGTWLAIGLGTVTAAVVALAAGPLAHVFGASEAALDQAVTYLRISALGIPAMLVVLADHRRAARPAGHPHTAVRRSRRLRPEHRAEPAGSCTGCTGASRGRRWGTVIAQTAMAGGARPRARPVCRPHGGAAARPPGTRARRRPRRHPAARAHPRPARGAARDDLGRGRPRRRAAGGLPGDRDDLDLPRLRPRRAGHRRAGDHRQGPRGRRGRPHPRRHHARGALGHRRRRRARGARRSCSAPWLGPLFTPDPAVQAAIAGGAGRRRPRPAALGLRLRRRRRAHRRRRRPVAGPRHARARSRPTCPSSSR